ncbi:hypothetical protein SNEBB_005525 [Seison nebaliae]|nr:hypothetical protein SNEBB_005525 [Seison nebaliae]
MEEDADISSLKHKLRCDEKDEKKKKKKHKKNKIHLKEVTEMSLSKTMMSGLDNLNSLVGWGTEPMDGMVMEKFVWQKKNALQNHNLSVDEMERAHEKKIQETKRELEKLNASRLQREKEREEYEREKAYLQKEREAQYHEEWLNQEDRFQLQQVKLRSTIRIEEGRAKPIDLLARYIEQANYDKKEDEEEESYLNNLSVEMQEPYNYLDGLSIIDLEDLLADIEVYTNLEDDINSAYWKDIVCITEDELKKLKKLDSLKKNENEQQEGLGNASISLDIRDIFMNKSLKELEKLEQSIKLKLNVNYQKKKNEVVDVPYWESVLAQLRAFMAKSRLKMKHRQVLNKRLEKMKIEQMKRNKNLLTNKKKDKNKSNKSMNSMMKEIDDIEKYDEHDRLPTPNYRTEENYWKESKNYFINCYYKKCCSPRVYNKEEIFELENCENLQSELNEKQKLDKIKRKEERQLLRERLTKTDEEGRQIRIPVIPSSSSSSASSSDENDDDRKKSTNRSKRKLNAESLINIVKENDDGQTIENWRNHVRQFGTINFNENNDDMDDVAIETLSCMPQEETMYIPDMDSSPTATTTTTTIIKGGGGMSSAHIPPDLNLGQHDGGQEFNGQVDSNVKQYLWSDKYKPRKPRFHNRVHTGYEWNQYNKKHYDTDNPPPKTVQGYKFNIFYPDLLEKAKTPKYTLTVSEDNQDFAVIRFSSGPPYEDIAFKIVNREWDRSQKHGFRCQYQNGIFQLWFHFRRWKYRR